MFTVGTYGDKRARKYEMNITQTEVGGTILDKKETEEQEAQHDYSVLLQGWFHFVQMEDGSIAAIFYSLEEDGEIINTKKAAVSAFQANFLGTKTKEEADPQSLHTSHYTYVSNYFAGLLGTISKHQHSYVLSSHVVDQFRS